MSTEHSLIQPPGNTVSAMNYGAEDPSDAWVAEWMRMQLAQRRQILQHRREKLDIGHITAVAFVNLGIVDSSSYALIDGGSWWYAWSDGWQLSVSKHGATIRWVDDAAATPLIDWIEGLPADESASVYWFYSNGGGMSVSSMPLVGNAPHDEFYPWLAGGLQSFYDDYLDSEANVLLLIGPPGTGKTSFLRGLLRSRPGLEAWVTYDQRIQASDELYSRFADPGDNAAPGRSSPPSTRPLAAVRSDFEQAIRRASNRREVRLANGIEHATSRILVLEDSDAMLSSRERGNDLMARLLNLADGLISLPKRKIVFSTNLPSLDSVDEALLRPGRCFAAVNFRKLDAAEATRAAASIGRQKEFGPGSYTLAQALGSQHGQHAQAVRRVGFV